MTTTPRGGLVFGQKRRRADPERHFVRDTNLWMEDGNIVLAATDADASEPNKEETTYYVFKCHRSILSKQSKVFEGLLGIPPSTETQDMYDELPLVMLPDAYRDVKKLLAYLYEPGEIAYAPGPHLWELEKMCEVLEELQGPLRLAAKYEFTKLHSLIGRTLEFMWPTTLDHWDARCDWEERNCDSDAWEPEHTPWAGHAVNLGYEARLLSIVPCAFYFLSRQLPQLISQYTSPSFKGEGNEPYIMTSVHSLLDGLAPPQFCQLIAGHQLLSRTTRNIVSSALPTITLYCVDCARAPQSADLRRKRKGEGKTPCASTIARWWKENTPTITGNRLGSAAEIVFYNPLKTLEELHENLRASMKDPDYHELNAGGICDGCQIGVETALQRLRQYFWDDLPYAFSVKPRDPDVVYGYKRYIQEYFTYCSNYD